MAFLSQSLFLQALGWATLNSLWQMAVLWLLFAGLQHLVTFTSRRKYVLALACLGIGLFWFTVTFIAYYKGSTGALAATTYSLAPSPATWNTVLTSASITYLLLLFIPAGRLLKSWGFIIRLRKHGLHKTSADYRLYVKKVALQLGIQKKVEVYLSSLITSPVTIGYLKPIILLPVAAFNSLTVQQVEAVLLHELSHIRRSDFLINLIINVLHTFFYYNPFVKLFVGALDANREKCCDETVLQFGYDTVSYAAALLTLEKSAASLQVLAIGAAGKKHLLNRIEKIVGMEKKPPFSFTQFAGLMSTLLLVILVNSVLFVSQPAAKNKDLGLVAFEKPFYATDKQDLITTPPPIFARPVHPQPLMAQAKLVIDGPNAPALPQKEETEVLLVDEGISIVNDAFLPVAYNVEETSTIAEEKKVVSNTIEATKKVLANTQWQEVEKEIADGMTPAEKEQARQEYLKALEKADWQGLANKLKQTYKDINWIKIQLHLSEALVAIEHDSLQKVYTEVLHQLEGAENCNTTQMNGKPLPLPDASQAQIKAAKKQVQQSIDSIRHLRKKNVISL